MLYDITMIGHVCKDTVFDGGVRSESLGGAVYFSSAAALRSGKHVHVITKAAEQDDLLLDEMRQNGIAVTRQDSPQTTCMALHYDSVDRERREILLAAQASSFSIASFPPVESRIFHLAGLVRGEIPEDFIPHLAQRVILPWMFRGLSAAMKEKGSYSNPGKTLMTCFLLLDF